jgi:hypothetical protein
MKTLYMLSIIAATLFACLPAGSVEEINDHGLPQVLKRNE